MNFLKYVLRVYIWQVNISFEKKSSYMSAFFYLFFFRGDVDNEYTYTDHIKEKNCRICFRCTFFPILHVYRELRDQI